MPKRNPFAITCCNEGCTCLVYLSKGETPRNQLKLLAKYIDTECTQCKKPDNN